MLNDYYQNIGMKGFIQRYGIVNAVKRGAFMFIKLHLVKDYEVRKVLWQEHASSKIKPYLKYKDTDVEGLSFPENDVENPIWIYWNKGIEQAPIIVQKCYESVCKHSNQKIILLNDQNLADYIRLPDYIEKKKDGIFEVWHAYECTEYRNGRSCYYAVWSCMGDFTAYSSYLVDLLSGIEILQKKICGSCIYYYVYQYSSGSVGSLLSDIDYDTNWIV